MSRVSYFLQWCFSRWTERNPYYEILRAHQQYARDCYGAQNNLGLRCKRHQKTWFMPFWCDGSFRLLCGQKCHWFNVGNCRQWKNYAWLWPPRELVLLSLRYSFVRCPRPQNQVEVLLLCGFKIFTVWVGKHIGVNFWIFRDLTKLLKLN